MHGKGIVGVGIRHADGAHRAASLVQSADSAQAENMQCSFSLPSFSCCCNRTDGSPAGAAHGSPEPRPGRAVLARQACMSRQVWQCSTVSSMDEQQGEEKRKGAVMGDGSWRGESTGQGGHGRSPEPGMGLVG